MNKINRRAVLPIFIYPIMAFSPLWENGETGIVARVLDGDSFVLQGGLVVRLAQIEAPRIRIGDDMGYKSREYLTKLIIGKKVRLKYSGLRRDVRGRALAQVFFDNQNGEIWVQQDLLKNGYARIHTYKDNRSHIEDFWASEREARRNARGLWANPEYQARFATPEALKGAEGTFQLIEGKIQLIEKTDTIIKLCFGSDLKTDVCALIPKTSWNLWRDNELDNFKGMNIRIRGRINGAQPARITKKGRELNAHGPSLWLDHPEQVEFIILKD